MAEFEVKGLAELKRKLDQIPRDIAKKLLRRGVGTAAGEAKRAAQGLAPYRTGVLKRSAIVKFDRTQSNATQAVFLVTFRRGKKLQAGAAIGKRGKVRRTSADAFYASWVEFGHKDRGGGDVQGKRFLTRSFVQGQFRYIATIERVIREGFEDAVR